MINACRFDRRRRQRLGLVCSHHEAHGWQSVGFSGELSRSATFEEGESRPMSTAKTVYLETMGCQMNALDSELVLGALQHAGYQPVDDMFKASLVLLNTCSVRQHAEDKVYSRLGQLKGAERRNPAQILAVIGCMAERDGDNLLSKAPHVDVLCGPADLHRLPALIADVESGRSPAIALSGRLQPLSTQPEHRSEMDDLEALDSSRLFAAGPHVVTPKVFGPRQAYVRITRGCNKYCSFCVVPYTRGREQHRPPDRIVEEVRRLAAGGVVEVSLLGQTVNHYRFRNGGRGQATTFAELLRRVHDEVPDLLRLRFVTSHPRDFTDDILEVMAACPRICRYLHLPAQSGSNAVLRRMNRGYTVEDYVSLLDRARSVMPDVSIAGDMIVGFSGETEADFQASLDLLRRANYKNCFVFRYSPRPGTRAAEQLPDDVTDQVKRDRNNVMLAVQAEISSTLHLAMMGQSVRILIEGPSKAAEKSRRRTAAGPEDSGSGSRAQQLVGRTDGDQIVLVDGPADWIGRLMTVRISAATPYTLFAEPVGEGSGADRRDPHALPLLR